MTDSWTLGDYLLIDALLSMFLAIGLRAAPRHTPWVWIASIFGVRALGDLVHFTRHASYWPFDVASMVLYFFLFYGGPGLGKRLWGKLKSAALTAVNQASFKQQQREAFQ